MDDMYNNSGNQGQDSYGGNQYQQSQSQPSIQAQLQYQYQQPQDNMEEPMTIGEWMISLLVMLIPCVNIVMMFVWAFSHKEKKSKSNFFKAYLIFFGIMLVFMVVMMVVLGISVATAFDSMGGYYY